MGIEYYFVMECILGDGNSFKTNNDEYRTIFKSGSINECQIKRLKSNGSRPGIMFGQPKIHKEDVPMRPILLTVGSFNFSGGISWST